MATRALGKRENQTRGGQEASVKMMAHAGPLPHPSVLEQYDHVVPGGAERIFKQFEVQAEHRQKIELAVIRSNTFAQRLGSVSAAAIGFMGVGGGLFLVHEGRGLEGFAAFVTALGSLVGVYVYGRRAQADERARK